MACSESHLCRLFLFALCLLLAQPFTAVQAGENARRKAERREEKERQRLADETARAACIYGLTRRQWLRVGAWLGGSVAVAGTVGGIAWWLWPSRETGPVEGPLSFPAPSPLPDLTKIAAHGNPARKARIRIVGEFHNSCPDCANRRGTLLDDLRGGKHAYGWEKETYAAGGGVGREPAGIDDGLGKAYDRLIGSGMKLSLAHFSPSRDPQMYMGGIHDFISAVWKLEYAREAWRRAALPSDQREAARLLDHAFSSRNETELGNRLNSILRDFVNAGGDFQKLYGPVMDSLVKIMAALKDQPGRHVPDLALAREFNTLIIRGGEPPFDVTKRVTDIYRKGWRDLEMGDNGIRYYGEVAPLVDEVVYLVGVNHLLGTHRQMARRVRESGATGIEVILDATAIDHPGGARQVAASAYLREQVEALNIYRREIGQGP